MRTIDAGLVTHALGPQQRERIDADATGEAFQTPEREVALATLDAAHVGAVNAERLREILLAQSERLTVCPQVPAHGPLKIAFHVRHVPNLLLDSLQIYK
jgi:hypothetical protein